MTNCSTRTSFSTDENVSRDYFKVAKSVTKIRARDPVYKQRTWRKTWLYSLMRGQYILTGIRLKYLGTRGDIFCGFIVGSQAWGLMVSSRSISLLCNFLLGIFVIDIKDKDLPSKHSGRSSYVRVLSFLLPISIGTGRFSFSKHPFSNSPSEVWDLSISRSVSAALATLASFALDASLSKRRTSSVCGLAIVIGVVICSWSLAFWPIGFGLHSSSLWSFVLS